MAAILRDSVVVVVVVVVAVVRTRPRAIKINSWVSFSPLYGYGAPPELRYNILLFQFSLSIQSTLCSVMVTSVVLYAHLRNL